VSYCDSRSGYSEQYPAATSPVRGGAWFTTIILGYDECAPYENTKQFGRRYRKVAINGMIAVVSLYPYGDSHCGERYEPEVPEAGEMSAGVGRIPRPVDTVDRVAAFGSRSRTISAVLTNACADARLDEERQRLRTARSIVIVVVPTAVILARHVHDATSKRHCDG
jgi:hypothetical protein